MNDFPIIDIPTHDVVIPSNSRRIKIRPMTVKEEKILLIAKESKEHGDMLDAVKQVVSNCIIDKTIKVNNLAIFDIEYIFIRIRAVSVSNVAELIFHDEEDKSNYKFEVKLNEIKVIGLPTMNDKTNATIKVTDKIALLMKYPSGEVYSDALYRSKSDIEMVETMVLACIDKIFEGEKIYTIDDKNKEKLTNFVEQLDINTYNKMKDFIASTPKLEYIVTYTNKMGTERKIVLDKLADFFTLY